MATEGVNGHKRDDIIGRLMRELQQLQQLLSQQSGDAFGSSASGGCGGDQQAEFGDIVNDIQNDFQRLTDRLAELDPGLSANGNSGDGRLNLHITV